MKRSGRREKNTVGCAPQRNGGIQLKTLAGLVRAYLERQDQCGDDLAYYREADTWPELVDRATMAEWLNARGEVKRHPHQRRIPKASLEQASDLLLKARLKEAKDFDDLHERIARATAGVWKFGDLTVYDTTHRIGAWLKPRLRPKHVYLHRGTRAGAKALGLDWRKGKLAKSDLPVALQRLRPEQAEDFLCRCKTLLSRYARQGAQPNGSPPARAPSRKPRDSALASP